MAQGTRSGTLEQALLNTVRVLSVDIGPRPSAGEREGLAAAYVADRLRAAGFAVRIEPFRGLTTFGLTYGIIYSLFPVAAVLTFAHPVAAFAVALTGLLAMGLENGGYEVVSRFLPGRGSRNVVGVRAPAGPVKRRVLLTCHLDSSRAGLLWHPRLVRGFRLAFLAMLSSMAAVTAVTGWMAFGEVPPAARAVLYACAGYLAVCVLILIHRELFMSVTPGANDNAAGVAAMLGAAEQLGDLRSTELWAVACGCEESGLVGMCRFCQTHRFDRATTYFINLDNCGAGRVAFTTAEGMLWRFRCDPELVRIARESAEAEPKLDAYGRPFHTMNNDSFICLRRGYKALSIMAFDERGVIPNWHWPTDTIDRISPATLACAAELATRMVRRLDS